MWRFLCPSFSFLLSAPLYFLSFHLLPPSSLFSLKDLLVYPYYVIYG